jgi:hypothetical protein
MKDSNFLALGAKDFLKGLLMAVLTPVFVITQQSLEAGVLTFDLKVICIAAASGAFAYITKNFFTPLRKID